MLTKKRVNNDIKVLTFNIFWAAMMASESSAKKGKLADVCYQLKENHSDNKNVCLHNVVKFFDDTIKAYGILDFIAIQEAYGWKEIIESSQYLSKIGFIHHSIKIDEDSKADYCTIYNHLKYDLLGFKCGDISTARPYHILFLKDKKSKENIIFINFHNDHGVNHTELSKALSKNLKKGIICSGNRFQFENSEKIKEVDISSLLVDKYHIITAGDTNDHGKYDYWKGITPLLTSHFKDIKVSTHSNKPPKTCCSLYRLKKGEDSKYGDYIMISDGLKYRRPNFIPRTFKADFRKTPTSDHLPSMANIIVKKK